MPSTFQALARLLEKIEAIKKRLEIIDSTADYLNAWCRRNRLCR